MKQTRRTFLATGALVGAGGFAGCLDAFADTGGEQESEAMRAQASFFVLYDFAGGVGGDAAAVESIVPFGQHGHGWEPSAQVQKEVLRSDAFVYMGEGFQPWADDIVTNLERDAPDVTVIEARDGIELLSGNEEEHEAHDEHEDESHDETESDDGDEEEHDHEGADPHFWLNPRLAKQAVENIRRGFVETDGGSADAYTDNANAYGRRLDELDAAFEEGLESRQTSVVLVAGHDSFSYLGHRYGFDVHALSGIAPDAEPSPRDVSRAQQVIEEHDIEYVLAPALESDRAAKQLVAETDAKGVLPITAVAGLTQEWRDEGWGYVEVMENVNLPSLKTALGAK